MQSCQTAVRVKTATKENSSHTNTHTHRQTVLQPFVRVYLGEPVPEKNIHPLTPFLLNNHPYPLPPSTTNHSIILAQSTYLAISLHNL